MFGGRKCTCTSYSPGRSRSCQKARVSSTGSVWSRLSAGCARCSTTWLAVHALELATERLLLLTVGLLGSERVALVVGLLASRQGQLDLGAAVLEVERQRDQRVAALV